MQMDRFHEKDSRLYQVLKVATDGEGTIHTMEQTPILMNQTMKEDLPAVGSELYGRRPPLGLTSRIGSFRAAGRVGTCAVTGMRRR